ncbi:MAG: HAMP domain-containing sensor histidine kinase [Candidatus Pacebacteria bacterium]|nr:HAMP domain-containing sensor histidine kinase [Candidatus Paceibacterota bacterium]
MSFFEKLAEKIRRWIIFAKENPQILYTIFLLVVIPIAFLVSGNNFLQAALKNQERAEKERIGTMHDVFVEFAKDRMNDPSFLRARIDSIAKQNNSIEQFRVVSYDNGRETIIASLKDNEIGQEDIENKEYYQSTALHLGSSLIFKESVGGVRHWKAVRAIVGDNNNPIGFIMSDISMANVDALSARNIRNAYYILGVIILLILFLLVRNARIVDYTVLYRKLEEVDKMKDDFVSMAAHELRTPLTVISGYADLLNGIQNLSEKDRENISRIQVSAKDLGELITDILDVARIQQGKMSLSPERIDAKVLLSSIADSFVEPARAKGLALRTDIPAQLPEVNADMKRMRQVLVNIIGNSVKYTKTGEVLVRAYEEGNSLVVRVSDTGIGISAENQKQLFQKFYRVKSKETEDIRGTGLGLWITGQIIQNMGGKISVESISGKGTDFIISFPVCKDQVGK